MRAAWLTPDALPTGDRWVAIWVPQGGTWEELVRGALAPLFDEDNFEQFGSLTPAQTAEKFRDYMFSWMYLFDVALEGDRVVGEVFYLAGGTPPGNALLCDGAIYQISDYQRLFDQIGNVFGGDGITTFAVPSIPGRTIIGAGSGSGLTPRNVGDVGGEETHILTVGEMPAHHHNVPNYSQSATFQSGTDRTALRNTPGTSINTSDTGGGGAHENMPPFIALTPYIRAI